MSTFPFPATDANSWRLCRDKRVIPLENNPEVLAALAQKLGLSGSMTFHEVFDIDSPDMLAFVPRPATALILIFPTSDRYRAYRNEDDRRVLAESGADPDAAGGSDRSGMLWFPQTIGNACGLMALLHAVTNGENREHLEPGSFLTKLIAEATPLSHRARAELLHNSDTLVDQHMAAASGGSTAAPEPDADVDLHFVAFVKDASTFADGALWELDGTRFGPIRLCDLKEGEDVLSGPALDASVRNYMRRENAGGAGTDLRFSLVAIAPA